MASDSRISWGATRRWDAGRKIFPSRLFPDIFGYAGDVVFPALALNQFIEAVDAGLMFAATSTPWERHEALLKALQNSFSRRHQADDQDFSILHVSRFDDGVLRTVHAWTTSYSIKTRTWTDNVLDVPTKTEVIERLGSGADLAKSHQSSWSNTAIHSREIFSSFCDAIASGTDKFSGGAPQLAGFYPNGSARAYGVSYNGTAFFNGLPVIAPIPNLSIEWRDRLFHRIDISTHSLVEGAQVHTRPKYGAI